MNWYKKAQRKNRLSELLKGFGMGAAIGLIGWLGLSTMADLQDEYVQNPQVIEQKIIEYNNTNPEPEDQQTEYSSQGSDSEEISRMIERHEGKKNKVYYDTMGIPTIGIGFNLNRYDTDKRLKDIGTSRQEILEGKVLTDEQIYFLFEKDLNEARVTAQSFLPNFNEHPAKIQNVIIDMAFNLGTNRLAGFKKFREALLRKDYRTAANEMIDSKWYSQVGNRSIELENIMNGVL